MSQLIEEARSLYDTIIIDTPPLLPVTDAALVAARADGAVVVVRHRKTTREQLKHSIERLRAVGARPLGVALNMVTTNDVVSYGTGYRSPGPPTST